MYDSWRFESTNPVYECELVTMTSAIVSLARFNTDHAL